MSGGGKKRKDLAKGQQQFNQFATQSIDTIQPYAQGGQAAFDNANALLGVGGDQQAATDRFLSSPFYTAGQNAFREENDQIDAGLAAQGLVHSSARMRAVEDARQRQFGNAFGQYLGLNQQQAGFGANAAQNIANTQFGQGQAALGTQQNIANTRQGFLGGLRNLVGIGADIGQTLKPGGFF